MANPITTLSEEDFNRLSPSPLQHIIRFNWLPSNDELREACSNVLTRPFQVTAYYFKYRNHLNTAFLIEEVDVMAEITRTTITPSRDTWTVPVTIVCDNCHTRYEGWQVLLKKWYDNRPYHFGTLYCPACPPITTNLWLAHQGVQQEKPATVTTSTPVVRKRTTELPLTINLEDFD